MRLLAGAHLLEMSSFIVECGLILFIFLFAAYFRMHWDRMSFGILLGLGFSACEHLATWSIITNAGSFGTSPYSDRLLEHGHVPRVRSHLVLLPART